MDGKEESVNIFDIILVRDLKRQVFSFLDLVDLLKLRTINSQFHDGIENDAFIWKNMFQDYFGVDIPSHEDDGVEKKSFRERFIDLSRDCTCTSYALLSEVPKNLFNSGMRDRGAKVSVSSRKYPFKKNLICPKRFGEMNITKNTISQQEVPESSLIFEHIIDKPLREDDQKLLYSFHCYFAHLVFCPRSEELTYGNALRSIVENKFGKDSFDFLPDHETTKIREGFDNNTIDTELTRMEYFKNLGERKVKEKRFDFDRINEFLISKSVIPNLLEKYISSEKSDIHSIYIDYLPKKNRVYAYWNFCRFKNPLQKLYKRASSKLYVILPFFPIFQSMKKIFTIPAKVLKKSIRKKMKVEIFQKKRKSSKRDPLKFKMKWGTFLKFFDFRVLGDVGQDVVYDGSHQCHCSSIFWYAREHFGNIKSFIIRGSDSSHISIDFKNSSFPIFDHSLSILGESYVFSKTSDTVEMLLKEREEEIILEEEWKSELEERMTELEERLARQKEMEESSREFYFVNLLSGN